MCRDWHPQSAQGYHTTGGRWYGCCWPSSVWRNHMSHTGIRRKLGWTEQVVRWLQETAWLIVTSKTGLLISSFINICINTLCICLSVYCIPVNVFICRSIDRSLYVYMYASVFVSVCLSHLFIYESRLCLSVCLIYLLIYISISLSMYLFVCLSHLSLYVFTHALIL